MRREVVVEVSGQRSVDISVVDWDRFARAFSHLGHSSWFTYCR